MAKFQVRMSKDMSVSAYLFDGGDVACQYFTYCTSVLVKFYEIGEVRNAEERVSLCHVHHPFLTMSFLVNRRSAILTDANLPNSNE